MQVQRLRFDCYGAALAGQNEHPQKLLKSMGITYQHATPQSMADQWWFWVPAGLPDSLPPYMNLANVDPMDSVGFGLDEETAKKIATFALN